MNPHGFKRVSVIWQNELSGHELPTSASIPEAFDMFCAETAVWIVYPSKKTASNKVHTFIDFLVEKT
jgi:hypothetical protein